MAELSPMMEKYMETKAEYKDCLLFYRLGDFYEMFFEDAEVGSRELDLTLTGKACGLEERAPMCGIPFHSAESYINRLVGKGYKVAICEQVEDPKTAKGLVKREVIRVVTPGTNNLDSIENSREGHNYILSVVYNDGGFGISLADVSTGDFLLTEVKTLSEAMDEIIRFAPSEIICNASSLVSGIPIEDLKLKQGIYVSVLDEKYFIESNNEKVIFDHFHPDSVNAFEIRKYPMGLFSAGALFNYLLDTQKNSLAHFTKITPYSVGRHMILDASTRRNLELSETMREKSKKGSLFGVLDKTKTAMGGRLLKSFIEEPLIVKKEIQKRLDCIEELNDNALIREELIEYLDAIYDLERLMSKIAYHSANPRDLIALYSSLKYLPHIRINISEFKSEGWTEIYKQIDELKDIADLIFNAIAEEPPLQIKEGGIIKAGYNEEIDRLRLAKTEGKSWLFEVETKEKEATGIKNLKVKYNKVFGYYFEVTNSYKDMVPASWVRKQTLTGAERYTNDELKKIEDDILGAETKLFSLEYDLFDEVREKISEQILRIQETARAIAFTDAYCSLSKVATNNNYVRPSITDTGVIEIKNGRHPVVESLISNGQFVDNDTSLDNDEKRISIITGPNMAGKSTYMRQTALIVLMAQMGSFVPASYAKIGIVDRIFTRVGASDDLASGQSTFMVEMNEVANILKNATRKSLLILDEIGRGTSTYDGLSIAWAVVEYIADTKKLGAKALFATHYHELTELEGRLFGVNNYCISVQEQGHDIIFLRKIIKGGADKSYGIHVARLAGVPEEVLERATVISELLGECSINTEEILGEPNYRSNIARIAKAKTEPDYQLSLFQEPEVIETEPVNKVNDEIIEELNRINVSNMTPIEALNMLYHLKEKLK